MEAEGQKPFNPVICTLSAGAQHFVESRLAGAAFAIFVDIGSETVSLFQSSSGSAQNTSTNIRLSRLSIARGITVSQFSSTFRVSYGLTVGESQAQAATASMSRRSRPVMLTSKCKPSTEYRCYWRFSVGIDWLSSHA